MDIENIDYATCPEDLRESFKYYIEEGVRTGSFLFGVLSNDLMQTCSNADEVNKTRIYEIVKFVYNQLPYSSYGSAAVVGMWMNHRGLKGAEES